VARAFQRVILGRELSPSRIGFGPLELDGGRLVAYLDRRTPWDS
jgi:hypothetical protein